MRKLQGAAGKERQEVKRLRGVRGNIVFGVVAILVIAADQLSEKEIDDIHDAYPLSPHKSTSVYFSNSSRYIVIW